MRFNVKESVKWIALSGMAITVTTGLINPSWAAAEQDSADAGVNVSQAVYGDTVPFTKILSYHSPAPVRTVCWISTVILVNFPRAMYLRIPNWP